MSEGLQSWGRTLKQNLQKKVSDYAVMLTFSSQLEALLQFSSNVYCTVIDYILTTMALITIQFIVDENHVTVPFISSFGVYCPTATSLTSVPQINQLIRVSNRFDKQQQHMFI